jgi:hypothetical protein
VVAPQTRGICNYEKTIYTHGSRDAPNVEGMCKVGVVSLHPYQDVSKTGTEEVEAQECARSDKGQKVAVIATTNTVVQPNTVVILRLDARVTDAAVMSAWGPPDVA